VDQPVLVTSPLSQEFEKDGHVVKVEIYGGGETDDLAFEKFHRTVQKEGLESVIGPPD
jgi:hypothetical protein